MLNGLSLFTGIGGIDLAIRDWVRPVAYCEIDRYAAAVLFSRMLDGTLPTAPIWPDVRTLSARVLPGIDIIYGGFPCQDVSTAGLRKGLDGERSGLFHEAIRLVSECRPKFVFLENVQGIRKYVPTVRQELEALGYDCRDGFLSAAEVGAPHARNRWWLLAYSHSERGGAEQIRLERSSYPAKPRDDGEEEPMAYSFKQRVESERLPAGAQATNEKKREPQTWGDFRIGDRGWWSAEPRVGRVANGIPYRVDRIKGLGNAVVPLQAKEAFKRLIGWQEVLDFKGGE